jgi:hypothetical protein
VNFSERGRIAQRKVFLQSVLNLPSEGATPLQGGIYTKRLEPIKICAAHRESLGDID